MRMSKHDDEFARELLEQLRHLNLKLKDIVIAQTTLDASLTGLTGAVNAAVSALATNNSATSTPDTVVAAYQAGVDAQALALAAATPPVATPATAATAIK